MGWRVHAGTPRCCSQASEQLCRTEEPRPQWCSEATLTAQRPAQSSSSSTTHTERPTLSCGSQMGETPPQKEGTNTHTKLLQRAFSPEERCFACTQQNHVSTQPCRCSAPRRSVPAGLSPSPSAHCSRLPPTNAVGCHDRSVHAAPGGGCVTGCHRTRASGWPPEGCRGQGQRGDDKLERDLVLATGARERAFLTSMYLSINVRKNSKKTEVGSRT